MTQSTKIRQDRRGQRCLNRGPSEDSRSFCTRKVSAFLPQKVKFNNKTMQTLSEQIINRCFFVTASKLLNKHFGLTDWGRTPPRPSSSYHHDFECTLTRGKKWQCCGRLEVDTRGAAPLALVSVLFCPRLSSEMLMKGFVEADRNLTD